jgi:hypothetical protein
MGRRCWSTESIHRSAKRGWLRLLPLRDADVKLDEVFALCEERKQPLSRALLMEYRAAMLEKRLSASTVNVRLSAVRKLIGEAQRNGIIGAEESCRFELFGFEWFACHGVNLIVSPHDPRLWG